MQANELDESDLDGLREINVSQNSEVIEILSDLKGLRDIMQDFNLLESHQGVQLQDAASNVQDVQNKVDTSVQTLANTDTYLERKQRLMRILAILGGGGFGSAGFLINPFIGIGTALIGSGIGWFLTREKSLAVLLRGHSAPAD